jgi:putative YjhG/YagF family dehydratase
MSASSQSSALDLLALIDPKDSSILEVQTKAAGPSGSLPLTDEMLRDWPSGDLFGLSQNAGMGWTPSEVDRDPFLILSTQGGLRAEDGSPIALGFHTGHWEIGLLVKEAAQELRSLGVAPFAGMVSDPCDGRTQGTAGMMDSLPYRNDAAIVFRRLIRSLPRRKGVLGIATCDKGLPAMMLALAGSREFPGVIVPGGVTLPPAEGEDAGKIQSMGARYSHGELTLQEAADLGCRACASPGGGCQFLGTAATAQVVAEALGLTVPHAALSPSGQPIWLDIARRSAQALVAQSRKGMRISDILTPAAIHNAMAVHAAFGGSTNLLLHIPAIAFAAGLKRPTVSDWHALNIKVPRLVSVLPNGPDYHPTVRAFLAGGVPEVMLHLRELNLLELGAMTASGHTVDEVLNAWAKSERRAKLRARLLSEDGVNPDEVIMNPARAKERGLTSTVTFPTGNIAPEGSVIKSTAIDPSVVDPDGVYRKIGPARVFTRETEAIAAIKGQGSNPIRSGDVLVLIGRGPIGAGMEEIYQITSALKHLSFGKHVAVITDARFSGVSTGACIGHVGPEALADGPIGRLRDGDLVRIIVDRVNLEGSLDLIGENGQDLGSEWGTRTLASRTAHPALSADPQIADDTRLWAALQAIGGGAWGGCVYDTDLILETLKLGLEARAEQAAKPI